MHTRWNWLFYLVAAVSVVVSVEELCADIAPDPLSGGETLAAKNGTVKVAMSEETVRLTIGRKECRTKAVFLMKNLTDAPVTIDVGFPVFYRADLLDFKASVDGKPVRDIVGHPKTRRGRGWKIWKMTFPASRTTTVEVSYRHELPRQFYRWGAGSLPWSVDRSLKESATDEELEPYGERLTHRFVSYILRTGFQWAGSINRCRIEVRFSEGLTTENLNLGHPRQISGLPPGASPYNRKSRIPEDKRVFADPKMVDGGFDWELKDFEPDRDVAIEVTHVTRSEMTRLLSSIHERDSTNPIIGQFLAAYRRAAGDDDAPRKMTEKALQEWQDRIAIWGPESKDEVRLRHSRAVWMIASRAAGLLGREAHPEPAKIEPAVRKIATRIQSQLAEADSKSSTTRYYRSQVDKLLKWCDETRARQNAVK